MFRSKNFLQHTPKFTKLKEIWLNLFFTYVNCNFRHSVCENWGGGREMYLIISPRGDNICSSREWKPKNLFVNEFQVAEMSVQICGPTVFSTRGHTQVEAKDNNVYPSKALSTKAEKTDFHSPAEQSQSRTWGSQAFPCLGRLEGPTKNWTQHAPQHQDHQQLMLNYQSQVIKLLWFTSSGSQWCRNLVSI